MNDSILRFIFTPTPVKGAVVRLNTAWKAMREFRHYPLPVTHLLGEMTAGALLLASSIKFEGSLIMQVQGDGPVRLAIVEVRNSLMVRASAKLQHDAVVAADATTKDLINVNGGGRCAIMLDPKDRREGEPLYQGVVSLAGDSIAQGLELYMQQSEQIHTRLWLAADEDNIGGLLIQKMPGFGGKDEGIVDDPEALNRIETLADTIKDEELLTLPAKEIAHRLFWEEKPQYFEEQEPRFACTCSRERVEAMILNLGEVEALQACQEHGGLEVTCDFCGKTEKFSIDDLHTLFNHNKKDAN